MKQAIPILLGCLFCLVSTVALCASDDVRDESVLCAGTDDPAGVPCDDLNACGSADTCDDGHGCAGDMCCPESECLDVIDSCPPDRDGDGVIDALDNCPAASNDSLLDTDQDGFGDVCDDCPALYNPGQNPDDCLQAAHEITVIRSSAPAKGSGTIYWTTTHEFDISGFNVQGQERDGTYARLNPRPIPCLQCITGQGASYAFTVPKLKSGRNLLIQVLGGTGDLIGIFRPPPGPQRPD